MTGLLLTMTAVLVVIAGAAVLGPRIGIAAPLVLVAIGVLASFLPVFEAVEVEPEWILQGVLPPLLYAAAVSMPAMNFRREFGAISGLSVLLVVASSLVLGAFFALVVPGLTFVWGVALGAIVSPTDAVATAIVKRTAVSQRVVSMLDGESLLNDATALVLLRTTAFATAAAFSFWGALGTFAYSVAAAVVIGAVVGRVNLLVRGRVTDPTVNTVISFAVPFLASVPAELLGASGLVAAVAAGLVTSVRAPRDLSPQNRLSDAWTWSTLGLVLEGLVFLTMGLQMRSIVTTVERDHAGVGTALLVAVGAVALTVAVRAAYVTPLLAVLGTYVRRANAMQGRLSGMQEQMGTTEGRRAAFGELNSPRRGDRASERELDRFAVRLRRVLADIDYFRREPLGWRDGVIVVWAGMRGAVTVAAAQTLPSTAPQRSVLVLVAFTVALVSLLVQGGTIGPLARRIAPPVDEEAAEAEARSEQTRIMGLLRATAETIPEPRSPEGSPTFETFEEAKRYRLAVIAAQRATLLDARDDGTFDADLLTGELDNLDASQIAIEMRGRRVE